MIRNESSIVEMMSSAQRDLEELKQTQTGGGVIPDGSITTTKLADGAVTSAKLASNAVTSGKINSNAVTSDKINSGAVTTAKLADANVTDVKLAHDADFLTEHRIGMFDGRPLYRLTIQATSGSSTNAVKYIKTFAMNNWYEVISLYGVIYQTDRLTAFPMDGSHDRPFLGGAVSGTNYQIYEQHPAAFYNSKTCRITIEYTKAS